MEKTITFKVTDDLFALKQELAAAGINVSVKLRERLVELGRDYLSKELNYKHDSHATNL